MCPVLAVRTEKRTEGFGDAFSYVYAVATGLAGVGIPENLEEAGRGLKRPDNDGVQSVLHICDRDGGTYQQTFSVRP